MSRRPEYGQVRVNGVIGTVRVEKLRQAIALEPDTLLTGFIFASIESRQPEGVVWGIDIDLDAAIDDTNAKYQISKWLENADKVEIRTPATVAGVLKWARGEKKKQPTKKVRRFNRKLGDYETLEVKTTVNDWLILLLMRQDYYSMEGEKARDLIETVQELYENGVVGYRQMTQEQLLAKIDEDLLNTDNHMVEYDDLEDLLESMFENDMDFEV
jgi:hypothetical protein